MRSTFILLVAVGCGGGGVSRDGSPSADGAGLEVREGGAEVADTDDALDTGPLAPDDAGGDAPAADGNDGSTLLDSGLPPDPGTVAPSIDKGVATSMAAATKFLYTGPTPIQTGVAPGAIEARRVTVLRGKVVDRQNTALTGVTISLLDRPELGQTLTRMDGGFDLAANGGGLLTVRYEKAGFLPVQRTVTAPWRDYVGLPDVVMIPHDTAVTMVDLGAATEMQVARGTPVSDADGARRATILFPPGLTATMVLPDGTAQPLLTLHVRATEYTVGPSGPNAMPGQLPPSSGYTYAVELSADEAIAAGASAVRFSQPVPFYVENFVGFPIGSLVPTGFYDRRKGGWVPSDSGRVIKVISVAGGLADLDLDGTGTPAGAGALAALGITDVERQNVARLYPSGHVLWRVLLPHFTPWDCNFPYGPPPDAEPPDGGPQPNEPPKGDPDKDCGSIIGCESQTLGEAIRVTGTRFSLHYQSDRAPGGRDINTMRIRLSDLTLPPGLQRIHLEVSIAGRTFYKDFAPQLDLVDTFTWDGKDAYGRSLQGRQPMKIRIGYEYPAQYYATSDALAASFNRFGSPPGAVGSGGGPVTFARITARRGVVLWRDHESSLGHLESFGLGGWNLSPHHAYDVGRRKLYLGNGDTRTATADGVITTLAGTGEAGLSGDDGPATQARFSTPEAVAVGADGSVYIADYNNYCVRRVRPDGVIVTVAGTCGLLGISGDNGPAIAAQFIELRGIAVGADGSLYVSDTALSQNRVRRVRPDGIIVTVAGKSGLGGFSGDGGPATEAQLYVPVGIAEGPDGSLYIADAENQRIRRVAPDGIITTVAGTSGRGFSGDGGLATKAELSDPLGVSVGGDGSLYIADEGNGRIRRVGPDGIITTVAGGGDFTGDGASGSQTRLNVPRAIALAPDGSLFIASGSRVRRMGPDGVITTVAGSGIGGFSGDGGPATQAQLGNRLDGVAVGPDGSLYVADAFNQRIRQRRPPLPGFSVTDISIAAPDGSEVYVFTDSGRHLRTLDALTGAVRFQFAYDAAGRLVTISDGDGNATTIVRDGSGNPSSILSPFGQRTTLAVDGGGYLSRVTNPAGEAVQLTYNSGDAEGLLATLTDPRGKVHRYGYDALGRLIRDGNPAGGVKTLARTDTADRHYAVTVTTASGLATTHEVEELSTGDTRRLRTDPSGAQTEVLIRTDGSRQVTYPDGTVTNLVEGPDPRFGMQAPIPTSFVLTTPGGIKTTRLVGRTATLSDPNNPLGLASQIDTVTVNGQVHARTFTAATSTLTTTSAAGRVRSTVLDARGRPTSYQPATGGAALLYSYDDRGRVAALSAGSGAEARTATFSYDEQGHLDGVVDPLGRVDRYSYDSSGRITTLASSGGAQVRYAYDANGNLTSLTPPGRTAHAFSYTDVGDTAAYTPPPLPGTGDTVYAHDTDGQLTRMTRPGGQFVDLGYDAAGRLATKSVPPGAITYAYDASTDQLAHIRASDGGSLDFGYDGAFLTSFAVRGAVAGSVGFAYDGHLRVTRIALNGVGTEFAYDADGLVTQAGDLSLARDERSGLLTATTLGKVNDARTYNGLGELLGYDARVDAGAVFSTQYVRDKIGRITRKVEVVTGSGHTYDYDYDPAGRLSGVTQDGAVTASYTYDDNGNRLTGPNAAAGAAYDAQDRLVSRAGSTYDYTANGELEKKTTAASVTTYGYDSLGNIIHVALPDGRAIDYVVDGQGRRIGKRINGVLIQGLLYQDDLRPIGELDGQNTVVSRFVYATRVNVPDFMIRGDGLYRIVTDHLGSPRLVIGASDGAIVERIDYDEFGRVVVDTNPGFQPFGFAGGIHDRDSGLVRFGARDYDPEIGRWTSKDPIGFDGGDANIYAYAANNPVNIIDPSGQDLFGGYWGDNRRYLPSRPPPEAHRCRNKKNKCPAHPPNQCSLGKGSRSREPDWTQDSWGGQKWRSSKGDECAYDGYGNLLPDEDANYTFNYEPDPFWFWIVPSPGHLFLDVFPHFLYGESSGYEPHLTDVQQCN